MPADALWEKHHSVPASGTPFNYAGRSRALRRSRTAAGTTTSRRRRAFNHLPLQVVVERGLLNRDFVLEGLGMFEAQVVERQRPR